MVVLATLPVSDAAVHWVLIGAGGAFGAAIVLNIVAASVRGPANAGRLKIAAKWAGALSVVLLVDVAVLFMLAFLGLAENCAGSGDWMCNESLRDVLGVVFFAIPGAYAAALVIAALVVWRQRVLAIWEQQEDANV